MSVLLQTLYPVSGRVRQTLSGNWNPIELAVNTPAGMHDNNNTTRDAAREVGDNDAIPASLTYSVDYVLDISFTSGTIDRIDVVMTQQKYCSIPTGAVVSAYPLIGGVAHGEENVTPDTTGIVRTWSFVTDPINFGVWINGNINALRWGFVLGAYADSEDNVGSANVSCSAYRVEVWGTAANSPQIYVTYGPLEVFPL